VGCEVDHSPPSSAEFNADSVTSPENTTTHAHIKNEIFENVSGERGNETFLYLCPFHRVYPSPMYVIVMPCRPLVP
jgi:hypothetical protein